MGAQVSPILTKDFVTVPGEADQQVEGKTFTYLKQKQKYPLPTHHHQKKGEKDKKSPEHLPLSIYHFMKGKNHMCLGCSHKTLQLETSPVNSVFENRDKLESRCSETVGHMTSLSIKVCYTLGFIVQRVCMQGMWKT